MSRTTTSGESARIDEVPDAGLFSRARLGEISSSLQPYGDSIGRLFSWRGELYRAIRPQNSAFYRRLIDEGVIAQLVEKGLLIESVDSEQNIPGYDLVFHHQRAPHVVYPTEWCHSMMRDAAIATLDAELIVGQHKATIEDAHPWNVVFRSGRPILVDLTAIIPDESDGRTWRGEQPFRLEFLSALKLMGIGRTDLAHAFLQNDATNGWALWQLWSSTLAARIACRRDKSFRRAPRAARAKITRWRKQLADESQSALTKRVPIHSGKNSEPLIAELTRSKAKSVIIIGDDLEHLSACSAESGLTTLACTTDSSVAEKIYLHGRHSDLDLIPVVINALSATSTFGMFGRPSEHGAPSRLRCDAVIYSSPVSIPQSAEDCMTLDQRIEAGLTYSRRLFAMRLTERESAESHPLWAEILKRHFSSVRYLGDALSRSDKEVWMIGEKREVPHD